MLSIFILSLLLQIQDCNYNLQMVDTNKRFSNIIDYIKHDSVIKNVIYKYYPEIECFDFPDTARFGGFSVEEYMYLTKDTNTSRKYIWYLQKKMDSINKSFRKKSIVQRTNFIIDKNCKSNYYIEIFFNTYNMWGVLIKPKKMETGLYRTFSYNFVFNENNEIIKVFHLFLEE